MKEHHNFLGYLKPGDSFRTRKGGEKITHKILEISIDPTDESGILIKLQRLETGKEITIGFSNLREWFAKANWKFVK